MEVLNSYFSMHNHSYYSFQDGYASPKEYLDRAKEIGLKGFAITEHGNQCSWVYFDELKKEYPDIKMVFGIEVYEEGMGEDRYYHLLILAKDEEGRKILNRLQRLSNEHFYYKPRITLDMLRNEDCSHLIVSTACLAGKISKFITDKKQCLEFIYEYKKIFPNFYLEMQSHPHEEQIEYNKKILQLSKETNVPFVITTDSHYAREQDSIYQAKHIQVAKDIETASEIYEGCYLQSEEEIHKCMDKQIGVSNVKIGLQNTLNILNIIDKVDMPWQSPQLPLFEYPSEFKSDYDFMVYLTKNVGWKKRGIDKLSKDKQQLYMNRIDEELSVIKKTGYTGYFLIVWDFIKYAQENGISVGAGRGCFTKDALVWCKNKMKPINEVEVGDEVLSKTCKFNKVVKTFKYDINEPMIEFEYKMQGSSSKKYINKCTIDHKILVNRDGKNMYIQAKELKIGDLLCSPKIKHDNNNILKYDLNDYNIYGFEYDDDYIYEKVATNITYKYSPKNLDKMGICGYPFAQNMANGKINFDTKNKRSILNIKNFFSQTPFNSWEEYRDYVDHHSYTRRKIKRHVIIDEDWNELFGIMYGDGWVINNKKHVVGIATNSTNFKDIINKNKFYALLNKIGINDITVNKSKDKNLNQYTSSSWILSEWFSKILFISKKGKDKLFNETLLNQSKECLLALEKGLFNTDGSRAKDGRKNCFDNTSTSLISIFKYLHNLKRIEPLALDVRLAFSNYDSSNCKESYKLRWIKDRILNKIKKEDDDYWYIPVTKIINHDTKPETVYDLMVENDPSYTINNIVVHNSACSSCVNWLMGITQPDPLRYDLVFSRFLNEERISLPKQYWA